MPVDEFMIGIVQGRLTSFKSKELQQFPVSNWHTEFYICKYLGIQFIELIAERRHNPLNPLWSDHGIGELKRHSLESGVKIISACTDFIIDNPIYGNESQLAERHLDLFLYAAEKLDLKILILPLMGRSNLSFDSLACLTRALQRICARATNLTFCIEVNAEPSLIKELIVNVGYDNLRCVFDTGNTLALPLAPSEQIFDLDPWIHHVHIKDKNSDLINVMLNTGQVDLQSVVESLNKINYSGHYVLENPRGTNPIETAATHLSLLTQLLSSK